jgi:molecular chaperone DnaK
MPPYWLGIDLGTTFTAAAIGRSAADGLEIQVVPLSAHSYAMPSVLFLPADGSLVVGEDAQRRGLADPYRVVREFKARLGDEIPLLVGGSPHYAHDLAASFVDWLYQYVTEQQGERPEAVGVTCPASWGPDTTALFERAIQHAGVPNVTLLTELQAAAISYASRPPRPDGATLAVYDLGGARFDVAVLRQDAPSEFSVLGRPEGIGGLGGLSFDEVLFEYVCAAAGVPIEEMDPSDHELAAEVAQLRRECTEAKETLSVSYDAVIPVTLGGTQHWVRLTRAEFEEMIRPDLDRTIEAMHRAFGSANVVAAELDAILLTGGSSRIPLVAQLIAAEFGPTPAIAGDPKAAVAAGAAQFAAPASAPVRDTGGRPAAAGAGALAGLTASLRHPSRKAWLGAAALIVLVVGGGVTALNTPGLSGLIAHHGTTSGVAAAGGVAPNASGTPVPSAESSVKPAGKARATTKPVISNAALVPGDTLPVAPAAPGVPAANFSNKVTGSGPTTKTNATKSAPVKSTHPATKPPTAPPTSAPPSTTPPSTTPPSTTPPSTTPPSTTPPSTTPPTTVAPSTPPPSTVAPSSVAPSTVAPSTSAVAGA